MICNLFNRLFERRRPKFSVGQAFYYSDSILMIVEIRDSDLMGFEYMVLMNGEVHGWLTETVVEELKLVHSKKGEFLERNSKDSQSDWVWK